MPRTAPKPDAEARPTAEARAGEVEPEQKTAACRRPKSMPQPEPKQEVKPDPVAEAIAADEEADAETAADRNRADARRRGRSRRRRRPPRRPIARKRKSRSSSRRPPSRSRRRRNSTRTRSPHCSNKEKASGGGAKRSTDEASFGGDKKTGDQKLPQSEMDALSGQLEGCWNIPAGAEDSGEPARLGQVQSRPSGKLEGMPVIEQRERQRRLSTRARSAPSEMRLAMAPDDLPADKHEVWADVIVNFDPSDMF